MVSAVLAIYLRCRRQVLMTRVLPCCVTSCVRIPPVYSDVHVDLSEMEHIIIGLDSPKLSDTWWPSSACRHLLSLSSRHVRAGFVPREISLFLLPRFEIWRAKLGDFSHRSLWISDWQYSSAWELFIGEKKTAVPRVTWWSLSEPGVVWRGISRRDLRTTEAKSPLPVWAEE